MNEFFELSQDIERALFVFDCTSNQALMRLYRRGDMTDRLPQSEHSDPPLVLGNGDNETVLLVYLYVVVGLISRVLVFIFFFLALSVLYKSSLESFWSLSLLSVTYMLWKSKTEIFGDDFGTGFEDPLFA